MHEQISTKNYHLSLLNMFMKSNFNTISLENMPVCSKKYGYNMVLLFVHLLKKAIAYCYLPWFNKSNNKP